MKRKINKKLVKQCPYCGYSPEVYSDFETKNFVIACENSKCKEHPYINSYRADSTLEMWNSIPERNENGN